MKKRIGLLFGGKSAEHEVSLQSAKNIIEAIDSSKYDVVLIGVDKSGRWHLNDSNHFLLNEENPKLIALNKTNKGIAIVPGLLDNQLINMEGMKALEQLDVVFPILHGTLGEDGSIQGLLRILNVPFVGSNVLGSAISMDKDIAKRLLKDAGLKVANSVTFSKSLNDTISFDEIRRELNVPLFIKPANQGSSVGVSKVGNKKEFEKAVEHAFSFDHKILIEEMIPGREIECSVLGNETPIASIPGEVIASNDFYSYEAKYIDESGSRLEIPAKLDEKVTKQIQEVSIRAFKTLNCEGMARVDVFLTNDNEIIVNEINTLPGFTKISMYPKLWEKSGIAYNELIEKLIYLAIERHNRETDLRDSISYI